MTDIPQTAIDDAAQAIADNHCHDLDDARREARSALEAAEQAWPHEPSKRDPASTAAAVTERAGRAPSCPAPPGRCSASAHSRRPPMADTPHPRNRAEFHRPQFYRYHVANPGFRFVLNRYPGVIIGAALVAGRYAYCVKWAWAQPKADRP
jgi:hypothetical protein